MRWPPPFRSLENPKEVWAWGMFDLANQSFTLLILTLLFPMYFREVAIGDPQRGDFLWSLGVSISLFFVVFLSPIIGAYTDRTHSRKKGLMITGFGCVVLTGLLSIIRPGSGWIGLLLLIPANICYQLGENLLASFLPGLSTSRTIGKISAIGWTMGYIGGLLLLIIVAIFAKILGWESPETWRPIFIIAAIWFGIGIVPAAFVLKEPVSSSISKSTNPVRLSTRFTEPIKNAIKFTQLSRFLIAFFIYGLGVQTMIAFAAILASDFGIEGKQLIWFSLQLTITAGFTAFCVAKYQDKIGVKPTVLVFLSIWIISCTSMFMIKLLIPDNPPQWYFWMIGNGIGIGLGGIGTSSRSMVGLFAPKNRTAEFFGLWGMSYKLAGACGILAFGQVKAWVGDTQALGLLTGFFVVGLVLTMRVQVVDGIRQARRTDRAEQESIPT